MHRITQNLLVLSLMTPVVSGQKLLDVVFGDDSQDNLGSYLAFVGDVNGDGHDDVIVGVPLNSPGFMAMARVYSGADRSVLYEFPQPVPSSEFGAAVAGAGDVNDDGVPDVMIGAPSESGDGFARVYSGADGSLLHVWTSGVFSSFGESLDGIGDVDGDGHDDVAVGNPSDPDGPGTPGSVTVFSGDTGAQLYKVTGASHNIAFGSAVLGAGDLNGDGTPDIVVGAPWEDPGGNNSGKVWALDGADGSTLWSDDGAGATHEYGDYLARAGDVNNDGRPDVLAGAGDSNYVRVLSGVDGSVIWNITGSSDFFGPDAATIGDINGDGHDDFAIGNPILVDPRDEVAYYSGRTGLEMGRFIADENNTSFGRALAGGGDLDGDGTLDLVIGNPGDDDAAGNAGSMWFFAFSDPIGTTYCDPAVLNTEGLSGVTTAYGSTSVADNCLTLWVSNIPDSEFGYFVASQAQGLVQPATSSGVLCLSGQIARFNRGEEIFRGPLAAIKIDLTTVPIVGSMNVLPGETWNFQAWYRDGTTNNFTDAVTISFQ